ncbi:MAG: carboxypeptidase regulatory-like domain-containing protein [Bacteroidota bacterium]|nr:carboxypeptidase regulatory-like domain-containing protein [Bacteroidota bacterium]
MKNKTLTILLLMLFASGSLLAQQSQVADRLPNPPASHSTDIGPILYDQMSNPSTGFIASTEFTDAASLANSSEAADDFRVPAGETWNIGTIAIVGSFWYNAPGGAHELNIYVYADDNGMPGTVLHTFEGITNFEKTETQNGSYVETYFEIPFSPAISLGSGKYWLACQHVGDNNVTGQWGWIQESNAPHIEDEFHWRNPGDGFGLGYTTWTPANLVLWFGYYDLSFALYDESFNNDLAAKAMIDPQSSSSLTASETIVMSIKNEGTDPQTGFDVSYTINGGTPVVENVGSFSINPGETLNYSFATTADLTATGAYDLDLSVNLAADQYTNNDSITGQVVNWGTVYVMEDGVDITACEGTFTDPGGLGVNFGQNDFAIMTIYPGNPTDKVRLDFIEFDVYWSDFMIYDGEDTDAPLIGTWESTFSPGQVTALNPLGALTIYFEAPGWADGYGWAALISCYTQPDDDFMVTDFSRSTYAVFTGRDFTFSATVRNIGNQTQSKDVTFYVGGTAVGTVNTGMINTAEYATVELYTEILTAGEAIAEAILPADGGDNPANNSMDMTFEVYPEGSFVEFFEEPNFPPDFWATDVWYKQESEDFAFDGTGSASVYTPPGQFDTLWSPQLTISNGDSISFWARTQMWWPATLQVVWKDANTGAVTFLEEHALDVQFYTNFQVDVSAAAGNNYIGFVSWLNDPWSWGAQPNLDAVVGMGPTMYFVDHDLTALTLQGNTTPAVNEVAEFDFIIRNIGTLDQSAGSYTVKLMQVDPNGDIELDSQNGQAIEHMEYITYTMDYTFQASGDYDIYAKVVFSGDQNPDNNETIIHHLNVQVSGTVQVKIGEGEELGYWLPIYTSTNYSLSETIYDEDDIGVTGAITGIKYYYLNDNYEDITEIPIKVWIGETVLNVTTGGWVPSTDLTKVYEDTVTFYLGEHEIYIPFDAPFTYDGGNVMLMVYKGIKASGGWTPAVKFKKTYTNDTVSTWATSYNPPIDPANPDTTAYPNYVDYFPNTTFFINTAGYGELAGTVYDEDNLPFEGVTVSVDNYAIDTVTDVNGHYFFNEILGVTQSVTASYFAYEDNTQSIDVQAGAVNYLDFNMALKPRVSVLGTVVGNDDPQHYLENAEVTLTGYFTFQTTTDENGDFNLPSVYGNETYTITIIMNGYETYIDEDIVVEDGTLDLGTIEMIELMSIPYAVIGEEGLDSVNISWSVPNTGMDETYDYEVDANNGYANEPNEHVWLGNIYETDDIGTIVTVDIYWRDYLTFSDYVTLDILDVDGNVVMSSEPFMTVKDQWLTVDIPDVTFDGTFYAMVHWENNAGTTDFLSIEEYDDPGVKSYAKIKYPGQDIEPLENYTGTKGTFEMAVNTLNRVNIRNANNGGRYVENYNIYKGLLSDVSNAGTWSPINTAPVTDTVFVDGDWPPAQVDDYVYAIKTIYTTGESVMSFSNVVNNFPPEFVSEPVTQATVSVEYEYYIEVDDPNTEDDIAITADEMPDWLTLLDNGDGTALLSGTPAEIGQYNVELRASDGQFEDTQSFVIDCIPVGVEELGDDDVQIYPNPVDNTLFIRFNREADARIIDVFGKNVLNTRLNNQVNTINTQDFSRGIYFLQIMSEDKIETHKFIKK